MPKTDANQPQRKEERGSRSGDTKTSTALGDTAMEKPAICPTTVRSAELIELIISSLRPKILL